MVSNFETDPEQSKSEQSKSQSKSKDKQQIIQIAQQMSQECIARRLRQVNRTVTRLYDEALRSHGLTVNQLNILAVIISEKQIRPGQLGQTLGMEKSTVSRTVDRMVSKGWLKVAQGQDHRTQLLTVTPKGHRLLLAVTPVWDTLQASILGTGGDNLLNMLAVGAPETVSTEVSRQSIEESELPSHSESVSADDFYL